MTGHSTSDIEAVIDTKRYPLHRSDTAAYHELLAQGRAELDACALFAMEGFVRESAIAAMVAELDACVPVATRYQSDRCAYYPIAETFPDDHPRKARHPCSYYQVLNYQIPNDSPLRLVYYWPPLAEFLRVLCGYDTFFRSDCPHLALTAKIAAEGDTDGWHFDGNDVVFSLLLQAPEAGGEFEYAPLIRTEDDERYDAVRDVFENPQANARRPG
ncbi:MAG: hypothetical protein AAF420_08500, partial [Pseudomonadota bacterium]